MNLSLQKLIDYIVATKPKNFSLFDISKKKIRVARSDFSHFYKAFWLTDVDKFLEPVARFGYITTKSQVMNSSIQQFITSAVISTITIAVATILTKHKDQMLSFREIIKKSLFLQDSFLVISLSNADITLKAYILTNTTSKTSTNR